MKRLLLTVMAVALAAGCAAKPKPQPLVAATTRPAVTGTPLIDLSRGGGGLPLSDLADLNSTDRLLASVLKAYRGRFTLHNEQATVSAVGTNPRHLQQLHIDLTDSVVQREYRPSQYREPGKPEPGILVDRFEYHAWPLLYQNGATRWRITAEDAGFSLLRNREGQNALVLSDAREGEFEFSVRLADMKPMLTGSASSNSGGTFVIRNLDIQFSSDNPHSLEVVTQVTASILLVPTNFRMHARADVDEWSNVRMSDLTCQGLDAGGAMLAALVNPSLQKYNGQLRPLVRWPGDRMDLHDVQFRLDDSLTITAHFNSRAKPSP